MIDRPVDIGGQTVRITCVSMGNPHCVLFGGDPDELDLPAIGPVFEHHPLFPDRVNTEFIQVIDENTLKMRVWERGSGGNAGLRHRCVRRSGRGGEKRPLQNRHAGQGAVARGCAGGQSNAGHHAHGRARRNRL